MADHAGWSSQNREKLSADKGLGGLCEAMSTHQGKSGLRD